MYHPTPIESNCCVLCTIRLNVERFEKTSKQKRVERKFERYLETGEVSMPMPIRGVVHESEKRKKDGGGEKEEEKEEQKEEQKEEENEEADEKVLLKQLLSDTVAKCSFEGENISSKLLQGKQLLQRTKNKEALERGSKYTSSVCLIIAGKLKRDREEVIEKVLEQLKEKMNEMEHFRVEAHRGFLNFCSSELKKTTIPSPQTKKKVKKDEPQSKPKKNKHRFALSVENSKFRQEDFELWQRYQAKIHNDPPSKLKKSSYVNFLCDSPLVSDDETYGSKHFRYFIDDKLVGVGVCDVLPTVLSSVYFYHDPDLMKLELGKLSALYEIDFVSKNRNTAKYSLDDFKYYYMGYYIHDCQKMRYKGEYKPSELRCPTTGRWVSLDDKKTLEKLDAHSFKLVSDGDNEVAMKEDEEEFKNQIVGVLQNGQYLGPTRLVGNGALIYHVLNSTNSGKKNLRMLKHFRRDIGGGDNEFIYLVDITPSSSISPPVDGNEYDEGDEEDDLLVESPSSSDTMHA